MTNAITAVISIYERFGLFFYSPPKPKEEEILILNEEEVITEDAEFEIIEPKQLPQ